MNKDVALVLSSGGPRGFRISEPSRSWKAEVIISLPLQGALSDPWSAEFSCRRIG